MSKHTKSTKGKWVVAIAVVLNLGILFCFKYLHWLTGLISGGAWSVFDVALPIGISFYTFQSLSYVIDVYRGKDKAQTNIINIGLYIAFFPQLIAGPIVRYGTIAEQLKTRTHTINKFSDGVWRFCVGLIKKTIIANQLAPLADLAFEHTGNDLTVVLAWAGALAFMLQIYYDFSGYSDMAIGLGKMFGFEFNENFNYPYVSRSISEYWRRWHISLGEWFRDYLYYPLSLGPAIRIRKTASKHWGRKAAGVISTFFVLFITWMATGVWHGANVTFIVWGLIQFICIFAEQYRKPMKNKKLGAVLGFTSTMLIILATKVIFKATDMHQAVLYYADMLHLSGNVFINRFTEYWLGQYGIILLIGLIFAFPVVEKINELLSGKKVTFAIWNGAKCIITLGLFVGSLAYAVGGGYNPFIYFNF